MTRRTTPLVASLLLLIPLAVASVPARAAVAAPAPAAEPSADRVLWYTAPARSWESESLPIGNGYAGASIFGGTTLERLQLNEKTLWTGGPGSPGYSYGNWATPRPGALQEVRDRIAADGAADPGWVAGKLGQPRKGYGAYQPFGELRLSVPDADGATNYRRSLDLRTALAEVRYTADGVDYRREYFASHPDNVIVARLSADQPGKVSFTATYQPQAAGGSVTAEDGRITLAGTLPDNGLTYQAQVQVVADGGTRADTGSGVTVSGADSAVLVWSAGTNYVPEYPTYRGEDPAPAVTSRVDRAAATSYEVLKGRHVADHRSLFDRVRLDLAATAVDLPTDQRLAAYRRGASDRGLEELFFAYGRYLLIASSRPGSLPANLQGVWNNSTSPPWSADYHVNINLQMNYWPSETTNLAETVTPYLDFISALVPPGADSARRMFGQDGWVVHNETNPYGFTGVHDWATAFWMPEANAWLAQAFWQRYLFSLDKAFLERTGYPMLKRTAQFWLGFLVTDPRDGSLVVSPSYSPEQGDFTAGASISQQLVTELLASALAAAEIVGEDETFTARLRDTLDRLDPGLRVGSWGQLQEWKEDLDDPGNTHRHVSHLYALFPGSAISPTTTPELAEAARVSLTARGDGGTGWSKAWKINFWARLLDGDHAHLMLSEQLRHSTLNNLWDTHPPFQIDGNFGATSGVAEMLLQSQADVVSVLPALPSAWPNGSVDGLTARGDLTVGATWADGQPRQIRVTAGSDGERTLRSAAFAGRFTVRDGRGHAVDVERVGADTVRWRLQAGQTYTVDTHVAISLAVPGSVDWSASFPAEVILRADGKTMPAATVRLQVPAGWRVTPAQERVRPLQPGEQATVRFEVAVPERADAAQVVRAVATGEDWSVTSLARVATVDPTVIPPGQLAVHDVDSEETVGEDGRAANAIDGNPGSFWHTRWLGSSPPHPHWVTVDLGRVENLASVTHLPRQDSRNGRIRDYQVWVSVDGTGYTKVAEGSFPDTSAGTEVTLDGTPARYVRLTATSAYVGPWTTVAELSFRRQLG